MFVKGERLVTLVESRNEAHGHREREKENLVPTSRFESMIGISTVSFTIRNTYAIICDTYNSAQRLAIHY